MDWLRLLKKDLQPPLQVRTLNKDPHTFGIEADLGHDIPKEVLPLIATKDSQLWPNPGLPRS